MGQWLGFTTNAAAEFPEDLRDRLPLRILCKAAIAQSQTFAINNFLVSGRRSEVYFVLLLLLYTVHGSVAFETIELMGHRRKQGRETSCVGQIHFHLITCKAQICCGNHLNGINAWTKHVKTIARMRNKIYISFDFGFCILAGCVPVHGHTNVGISGRLAKR